MLHEAATGQRRSPATADDQVIEEPDIDQLEGRFQAPRDALVRLAGLGNATRVVVGQDDSRGDTARASLTTSRG